MITGGCLARGGGDKPSRLSGLSRLPPPPSAFLIFEKSPPLLPAPSLPAARRLACAGRTALAAEAAAMQRLGVRHVTKPLQTSSALSAACTRTLCALGGGLARARKVRPVNLAVQELKRGDWAKGERDWRRMEAAGARTEVRKRSSRRCDLASVGAARARSGKIFPMVQCGRGGFPPLITLLKISRKDKDAILLPACLHPLNALSPHGNHGGHDTREGQVAEEQVRRRCHPR